MKFVPTRILATKLFKTIAGVQVLRMASSNHSSEAELPKKRPLEEEAITESAVEGTVKKHIVLNPVQPPPGSVRVKKRSFALLLSYSGKGYLGMQRNEGFRTIEQDLLKALLDADLINEDVYKCPQINHFQRAARTDKGVSAARQIVSMKLPEGINDMADKINEHLTEQIRVMDVRRATKNFNSKFWCDARTYSYLCPTFSFTPLNQVTVESYRIDADVLKNIKSLLWMYKGTHNFHNFTARKKSTDDSAKRFIMDVEVSPPFERDNLEWILIKIKGQSFMLHQIRKMIGLVIAICRGMAPHSYITRAFTGTKLECPIAPGVGLVLEEPHYSLYNQRFGNDGFHEKLDWAHVGDKIQKFREEFIDKTIFETEVNEKSMFKWLETLSLHNFAPREEEDEMKEEWALRNAAHLVHPQNQSPHCADDQLVDVGDNNNVQDIECNEESLNNSKSVNLGHYINESKSDLESDDANLNGDNYGSNPVGISSDVDNSVTTDASSGNSTYIVMKKSCDDDSNSYHDNLCSNGRTGGDDQKHTQTSKCLGGNLSQNASVDATACESR